MIRRMLSALLGVFALTTASACAQERYGEVYDPNVDPIAAIDEALARAQARDVPTLMVFGANWCHDSRGLAHRIETDEALNAFVAEEFELVFVNVGQRDLNLDQMSRFGVDHIFGTPTVLVADAEGQLLNAQSVHHWRTVDNAGSADIGAYLASLAGSVMPIEADAYADLTAVIAAWEPYQTALSALEESDLTEDQRAVRIAYYEGLARSMARLTLGDEAGDQDLHAIDLANLTYSADALEDLTDRVIERLNETETDLVARGDRELRRYED